MASHWINAESSINFKIRRVDVRRFIVWIVLIRWNTLSRHWGVPGEASRSQWTYFGEATVRQRKCVCIKWRTKKKWMYFFYSLTIDHSIHEKHSFQIWNNATLFPTKSGGASNIWLVGKMVVPITLRFTFLHTHLTRKRHECRILWRYYQDRQHQWILYLKLNDRRTHRRKITKDFHFIFFKRWWIRRDSRRMVCARAEKQKQKQNQNTKRWHLRWSTLFWMHHRTVLFVISLTQIILRKSNSIRSVFIYLFNINHNNVSNNKIRFRKTHSK